MNYKNIIVLVIAVGLIGTGISYYLKEDVCATGITYKIESIDERFELAEGTLQSVLLDAEKPWETAYGGDIFRYDPNGKLKIKLVYDDRQARTDQEQEARGELESQGKQVNKEIQRLEALDVAIQEEEAVYQGYVDQYDKQLAQYNRRKEAGASARELQGMESAINILVGKISSSQTRLNSAIEEFNTLLNKTQLSTDQYNQIVDQYNSEFTGDFEFDQGDHVPNQITIYEFESLEALELVLTHEMGHALGLDHVEDPKSIMHYLLKEQDQNNIVLGQDDIDALKAVCAF